MDPQETARHYDALVSWWLEQMKDSSYGIAALERALTFVEQGRQALDVGCGGEGRFFRVLAEQGFHCAGLDISTEMIRLAKDRYPDVSLAVGDICTWQLPHAYDVITAWDSLFHLPLENHEAVIRKLCDGLSPKGVLLFSCGGVEEKGTVEGAFGGQRFEYSSLGVPEFARILWRCGCAIYHLEYDQYPEKHAYFIAKKI
jgi:2-polyprenyl-3-methyl-5-hydroxy-6-metoxy-1,4-benzoquinol methylase